MNKPIELSHKGLDQLNEAQLLSFAHDSYAQNVYQGDEITRLQAELDACKTHVKLLGGFVTKVRSEISKRIGCHIDPEASFCSTMANECTKILAKTPAQSLARIKAQAVTDLITECSYSGVVDGMATSIIDVDSAISYADRLEEG